MSTVFKKALYECEISQEVMADHAGTVRANLSLLLNGRAGHRKRRQIIDAFIRESHHPDAAKIRQWLTDNRTDISGIWEPCRLKKNASRIRAKAIRRGIGISEKAMVIGDPNALQTHQEAIMLTIKAMRHFGIKRNPFVNEINDLRDIFLSEEHLFIKEMMLETAKHNGITAVFGEVGCGKSTMRKAVVRELSDEGIHVIYPVILDKTKITASTLLDAIVMDISDDSPKRSMEAKTRQALNLLKARRVNGLRQVLMIEEAHMLNVYALKAIKQIWEFEDGYAKLVGVVLIGQPELGGLLDESRYPHLREIIRRTTLAEINGLSSGDVERYLAHKFERVGGKSDAFTPDAFEAVTGRLSRQSAKGSRVSKAYPLSVNNLAAKAMNRAAEMGEPKVSAELIHLL